MPTRFISPLIVALAFALRPACAQLAPTRLYVPLNQPVPVTIKAPTDAEGPLSVRLIDPSSGRTLESAPTAPGPVDLASLFPSLWAAPSPRVLLAQLACGEREVGAPLVLQPLVQRDSVRDALTQQATEALRDNDPESLSRLGALGDGERSRLASTPAPDRGSGQYCGLRVYEDRLVRFETTAGTLTIALRPDCAPNTCFVFRSLVEGGLYDTSVFHRVVAADALGRPFLVQGGDPTGLGLGGPGFHVEFERSTLTHDLGVVSLARRPTDLNSGGSQFFICLSREACAPLDGQYAAFGEVVEGLDTLDTIAAVPTGPIDPANPASAHERPLDPPVILKASTIPAPPFGERQSPVSRSATSGVER